MRLLHCLIGATLSLSLAAAARPPASATLPQEPAAPAQNAPPAGPSARLDSVAVTGSKRFSSEQLAPATGLKPGSIVTRADLQSGADALSQLGWFARVGYRFSSTPGGVSVEYQVEDAPGLPVFFDNFPWVSDDDLTAAIKASVPLFDGTAPAAGKVLEQMSSAMALYLERKGVFVRISSAPSSDPITNRPVMQFLAAGAPEDVKSIEFSDPIAANNPGVHDRLADLVGKPYSRTTLELFEVEQLRPLYDSRGMLDATFDQPEVTAAPPPPVGSGPPSAPPPSVAVRVKIDPGGVYTWGGVIWTGNSAISAADLNNLVPFKPGAPTDGTKIQAVWISLLDLYGHRGYIDAKADPTPQFDNPSHRASYAVSIVEGPQYHMGKLVLTGLSLDGERHIEAGWKIPEGAVFDESFFDDFIDHGAKESFGDTPFNYQKVGHFLDRDPAKGVVNVMIDFQ